LDACLLHPLACPADADPAHCPSPRPAAHAQSALRHCIECRVSSVPSGTQGPMYICVTQHRCPPPAVCFGCASSFVHPHHSSPCHARWMLLREHVNTAAATDPLIRPWCTCLGCLCRYLGTPHTALALRSPLHTSLPPVLPGRHTCTSPSLPKPCTVHRPPLHHQRLLTPTPPPRHPPPLPTTPTPTSRSDELPHPSSLIPHIAFSCRLGALL
jgi:hypothetical protein